jgi:hypothetical protein
VAWMRIRCCVGVGTGIGWEGARMREETCAGLVYVVVSEPVERIAFCVVVLGFDILSCTIGSWDIDGMCIQ